MTVIPIMVMGCFLFERLFMGMINKKIKRFLYKYSGSGIPQLIKSIVIAMAILYVLDYIFMLTGKEGLIGQFIFDRDAIFSGQIWRIISFIIIPPFSHPIFIFFALYLFWLMGTFLEQYWGVLKFNLFYFSGVLFTIIGGLILGSTTNTYLNLSILFAFAILNPDFEIRLFFFIPVKMKYIGIANAAIYTLMFIFSNWPIRAAILISLLNVFIFFGKTMFDGTSSFIKRKLHRMRWKRKMKDLPWK
ncbi:MAG: hypothetical protein PHF65_01375 [Oscillospiraceae bacterium]|nr:hypothetical protein [Oscillospiraceae bacterium]